MSEGIRHGEFSTRIHDSGTNQPSSPNTYDRLAVLAVSRNVSQTRPESTEHKVLRGAGVLFRCQDVSAQACCRSAVFVSDESATFKLRLMNSWEKLRVVAGNFTKSFRVGLSRGKIAQSAVRKSVFEGFSGPPAIPAFSPARLPPADHRSSRHNSASSPAIPASGPPPMAAAGFHCVNPARR